MNWIFTFATVAITLVISPLVVRRLGNELYGVWSFLNGLALYSNLLYMGLGTAFVKSIAELRARDDRQGASRVASVMFSQYLAIGSVCLVAALAIAPRISGLFAQPLAPAAAMSASLTCVLIGARLFAMFVGSTFSGVLAGQDRVDLFGVLQIASLVLRALAVPFALRAVDPLVALAVVFFVSAALELFALERVMKRLWPEIKIRPVRPERAELRALHEFGIQMLFVQGSILLISYTDTAVIGVLLGASSVTLYALPLQLVEYGRILISGITNAMLPRLTVLRAQGNWDELQRLYLRSERICGALAAFVNVNLVILGPDFLRLWIGPELGQASRPVLPLLGAAAVAQGLSTQVSIPFCQALNALRWLVLTLLGEACANFVLSVLLCRPLGIQGVAVATLLPTVFITLAVLPAYLCRRLGVSAAQFVRHVVRPVVTVALLSALVQQGLSALLPVTSYAILILRGALSLGGALAGVMLTFPAQETEELSRLVRYPRRRGHRA